MLNLNTIILWFMEDPIGKKKLPWKTNFLKVKCLVVLYMLTRILFPQQGYIEALGKEDVVPLCFLT